MDAKLKTAIQWGLVVLLVMALAACGGNDDEPERYTIGVINPVGGLDPVVEGFKEGLADLGYTEGENLTILYDGPFGGAKEDLDAQIQKMKDAKVDLILGLATPVAQALKAQVTDTPVIFAPISDPLGAGLVETLTQPGGNLTGISVAGQAPPRLEWVSKLSPDIKRVWAVYNPDDAAPASEVPEMDRVAEIYELEMVYEYASSLDEMQEKAANPPDDIDTIFIMPDSLAVGSIAEFGATAQSLKIPLTSVATGGSKEWSVLTYGFDPGAVGKQSARLADQALKGTEPSELPVERAEYFVTINLAVAEKIGFEVPDVVLDRAETIIYPEDSD